MTEKQQLKKKIQEIVETNKQVRKELENLNLRQRQLLVLTCIEITRTHIMVNNEELNLNLITGKYILNMYKLIKELDNVKITKTEK